MLPAHTGTGKPVQGQTSSEGKSKRLGNKEGSVLSNERDAFKQQGLGMDYRKGGTANASTVEEKDNLVGAEDCIHESAENLAAGCSLYHRMQNVVQFKYRRKFLILILSITLYHPHLHR